MNLSYTKLATLLFRIIGICIAVLAIPAVATAVPALFRMIDRAGTRLAHADTSLAGYFTLALLQPVIGVLLIVLSGPLSRAVAASLDEK